MSEDNSDFATFFAGMIIGGLVGAATALLLAPQSGEATRTLIRDKGIELKEMAVEYGQDVQLRAEKALDDTREQLDVVLEDLKTRTDELTKLLNREKEQVEEAAEEG
ncbi:MAG: YtxH domain-containing protein [Anaerolineales bacterium]|nr:YtxH domain-containing protein [Anaerolineales bacterium]